MCQASQAVSWLVLHCFGNKDLKADIITGLKVSNWISCGRGKRWKHHRWTTVVSRGFCLVKPRWMLGRDINPERGGGWMFQRKWPESDHFYGELSWISSFNIRNITLQKKKRYNLSSLRNLSNSSKKKLIRHWSDLISQKSPNSTLSSWTSSWAIMLIANKSHSSVNCAGLETFCTSTCGLWQAKNPPSCFGQLHPFQTRGFWWLEFFDGVKFLFFFFTMAFNVVEK